jgi:hypothetical protein
MFIFQYITDADFHWRLSKCTYQLGQIEGGKGNPDEQKEMFYTAKDIAERALHLYVMRIKKYLHILFAAIFFLFFSQ